MSGSLDSERYAEAYLARYLSREEILALSHQRSKIVEDEQIARRRRMCGVLRWFSLVLLLTGDPTAISFGVYTCMMFWVAHWYLGLQFDFCAVFEASPAHVWAEVRAKARRHPESDQSCVVGQLPSAAEKLQDRLEWVGKLIFPVRIRDDLWNEVVELFITRDYIPLVSAQKKRWESGRRTDQFLRRVLISILYTKLLVLIVLTIVEAVAHYLGRIYRRLRGR